MRLRPRQADAVDRSLAALNTHRNTLLVAPTGAGKTIMLSAATGRCIAGAPDSGPNKALILQHRDELLEQNVKKFKAVNPHISVSVFDANHKSFSGRAVFAMVQTLSREKNLAKLPPLNLVTIDEAHHVITPSYIDIIERARALNPNTGIFGVTATPNRGDGKGLRKVFDNVGDQITIGELVASGHLVRPRTFVIDVGATEELKHVRKLASDFDMEQVAQIMDKTPINDRVIGYWREKAGDRKTVVFCSNVEHAEHVCAAFRAAGVAAATVHKDTPNRAAVLASFARGEIQVIGNVAVLTEGYDHPPVACVILLRPSSFKSTMIQMVGRGLRTVDPAEFPGVIKTDCIVLDFGTASLTHGALEEDVVLDDKPKGNAPVKECPGCAAHVPISTLECPLCGYAWEPPEPKERGELGEFVMSEVDLLAKSNFRWVDLWGDDRGLIASGFDAWAGIFEWKGVWHAVGGGKEGLRHLGVGERIVALALGDDYLNGAETDSGAYKSKRWLREPATEKQLAALGMDPFNVSMTKYEAGCRMSFKFNKGAVLGLVRAMAKERKAA